MTERTARDRGDAGAAAVEMAIVLPLVAVLLFGVIDLGRVLFTSIAIQGAAQEGSMYASFIPDDHAAVRQRVIESLESPTLRSEDITVSCLGSAQVEIVVTHDVELMTPILGDWFGSEFTLTRSVTGHIFSEAACDPSP
jgi:Flp pilus assembly protein TadG